MKKQLLLIFLALAIIPFSTSHCSEEDKTPRPGITLLGLVIMGALGYGAYRYIKHTSPSKITDHPTPARQEGANTTITTDNKKLVKTVLHKEKKPSITASSKTDASKHTQSTINEDLDKNSNSNDQTDKNTSSNATELRYQVKEKNLAQTIENVTPETEEKKPQSQPAPILNNPSPHCSLKEKLFQMAHNSLRKITFDENSWD